MNDKRKCYQCGLVNWQGAIECHRCGAVIALTQREHVSAATPAKSGLKSGSLIAGCLGILLILLFGYKMSNWNTTQTAATPAGNTANTSQPLLQYSVNAAPPDWEKTVKAANSQDVIDSQKTLMEKSMKNNPNCRETGRRLDPSTGTSSSVVECR